MVLRSLTRCKATWRPTSRSTADDIPTAGRGVEGHTPKKLFTVGRKDPRLAAKTSKEDFNNRAA